MSIGHLLLTGIAAFSVVCMLAVLFFERKNPASSMAWLLVLAFLPIVGFILYMFLGSGFKISKRNRYRMKAIRDNLYNNYIIRHLSQFRNTEFVTRHEYSARLLTYLRNEGEGVLTNNNAADIFTDGADMFPRMMEDMRQAKNHIHVLFYIFRNDALGREIIDILTEKAKSGVEVRLMYDSIGTLMAFDTMFRGLIKAGGAVVPFSPIFSTLNSHLRLNYRNHRKIVVIDGTIGYVGGMNVGEEYCGKHKKLRPWRDTHLRITGSAVWFLQERFVMDWAYSSSIDPHNVDVATYFPEPMDAGTIPMQIISSGPDRFESPIKSGMLDMIYSARKNINIQTPYYAPDASLADAVRIAAHSDVDVRLMIPRIGDYGFVQRATLGYAWEALQNRVKVYLYDGFLHAKTIVVDGQVATIGTTNLTNRSFTLDFEVNAFVYDQEFAQQCETIFHNDIEHSELITKEYFEGQSSLTKISYNFVRLFAPMM